MIKPLSVALNGYLHGPLAIATDGYITLYIAVFEPIDPDPDESGGGRAYISTKKLTMAQLAQVQRDDEELIAIVTVIGRMIL